MSGSTSRMSDSSNTGTDGLAQVSTDGRTPAAGRYLASLRVRPTPAPPTGGKTYETSSARIDVKLSYLEQAAASRAIVPLGSALVGPPRATSMRHPPAAGAAAAVYASPGARPTTTALPSGPGTAAC